jgi:hypothetical protein
MIWNIWKFDNEHASLNIVYIIMSKGGIYDFIHD